MVGRYYVNRKSLESFRTLMLFTDNNINEIVLQYTSDVLCSAQLFKASGQWLTC